MKKEAISTGFYESPMGPKFPRIQIRTIGGLLAGTERASYPDMMIGGLMFKKASSEKVGSQDKLFGDERHRALFSQEEPYTL